MNTLIRKLLLIVLLLKSGSSIAQINLNPCITATDFKIVVLGSSTAAGTGPSHPDSTWVNKYRTFLQNINPNNQVINLAVGGYTTYKIMPDSFAAPSNRPSVDYLHNISKALSYSPDAIIINLPSNDRQWPKSEQLSNFDSLFSHSFNIGVPLFICTTQPIAPISSAQYQKDVADSILAKYGSYAIDIFYPLADTNYTVNPQYAADAVHLNDVGHEIIFSRVVQKDILQKIYVPSSGTDLGIIALLSSTTNCTDSNAIMAVEVNNFGDTILPGNWLEINVNGSIYPIVSAFPLSPCHDTTLYQSINLFQDTSYTIIASVSLAQDSVTANNSDTIGLDLHMAPELFNASDTSCLNDMVNFESTQLNADTILYYSTALDSIPLDSIPTFALAKDTILYAQAVYGDLNYKNLLLTQPTGNINFNGNMFDLYPVEDIELEEIEIRPNSVGSVPFKVFKRIGSHQGYEQNAGAWTQILSDTLNVIAAGEWTTIAFDSLSLIANDTTALYIQMGNGHTLNYQSSTQPNHYSTSELQFYTGTGVAYNFGNTYYPRTITARFNYAFGKNYLGTCHSSLEMITKTISKSHVNLDPTYSFTLEGDTVFSSTSFISHYWINTTTKDTISTLPYAFIDSSQLQSGSNSFTLKCIVTDKWDCVSVDSALIHLSGYASMIDFTHSDISIFPNPTQDYFSIELTNNIDHDLHVKVLDLKGQVIIEKEMNSSERFDVSSIPNGMYIIKITAGGPFYSIEKLLILRD